MNRTPEVAKAKQRAALARFGSKLDFLERLIASGELDQIPSPLTIASFATWEVAAHGVERISRELLYNKDEQYICLQARFDANKTRVAKARAKPGKKEKVEATLRRELEDAEAKATSYFDQYSGARAALGVATREIMLLRQQLSRLSAKQAKISPLNVVPRARR